MFAVRHCEAVVSELVIHLSPLRYSDTTRLWNWEVPKILCISTLHLESKACRWRIGRSSPRKSLHRRHSVIDVRRHLTVRARSVQRPDEPQTP